MRRTGPAMARTGPACDLTSPTSDLTGPACDRLKRARRAATAVLAALIGAGCTAPSVYDAAAGFRRASCDRVIEPERRAECLRRADADAATYERERERATERR